MPQTIEIEIDDTGRIHPLEAISRPLRGRALLTLLNPEAPINQKHGSATQALALLRTTRFKDRPPADPNEVEQRINHLRNGWSD